MYEEAIKDLSKNSGLKDYELLIEVVGSTIKDNNNANSFK
jgi:hypothetical protein